MRWIVFVSLMFGFTSLNAASFHPVNLNQLVKNAHRIVVGVAKKNSQNLKIYTLDNAFEITDLNSLDAGVVVFLPSAESNIDKQDARSDTVINPTLPQLEDGQRYMFFYDKSGRYSAQTVLKILPDNTVTNYSDIPIIVDPDSNEVHLANIDYDMQGVTEQLLKYSDTGEDRILYYSRAKTIYSEKPSTIEDLLEAISRIRETNDIDEIGDRK